MAAISNVSPLYVILQGIANLWKRRPLVVSFEVTHSCNANCKHCDKGGPRKETLASPQEYQRICREIRPIVAQLSGGEPLLRPDLIDIARALKQTDRGLPILVLVTNGALLTEEKYRILKEAGVDQFSISLDYPDERHDDNRNIPGLFAHLDSLLPRLARYGNNDITLICVIRRGNIDDLESIVRKADQWNVAINFSVYTPLRTGDPSHLVACEEDLQELERAIRKLIVLKRRTGRIFTSERVLWRYFYFFKNGGIPNCKAGVRSLVINPDRSLAPCAMYYTHNYPTQQELIKNFSRHNTCGGCYVSLRAHTDKPVGEILIDALRTYGQMRKNSC